MMENTSSSDSVTDKSLTPTQPASATSADPFRDRLQSILNALPPVRDLSLAEAAAERKAQEDRQARANRRDREFRWESFIRQRGPRYADCRIANFQITTDAQRAVVSALTEYARRMDEMVSSGMGVFLYGPCGTGKDHLLTALLRVAVVQHGKTVEWRNGADLFGEWRDAIGTGDSEKSAVLKVGNADVLAISDPLPPLGSLTEWQAAMLFRVLDYRYSRSRPTWVSVNVANRAELDTRLGPQLADRIIDGALVCFCNWPSYRRSGNDQVRKAIQQNKE